MAWLWLFVAALGTWVWLYLRKVYNVFEEKGIKYLSPTYILGNLTPTILKRKHQFEMFGDLYKAFPGEKYCGHYEFMTPRILIRDPEIIRNITVKDFDHFVDHVSFSSSKRDPLFTKSLFALKGQKWREMRTTLSPAFTGSKMRYMTQFMVSAAQQTIEHLKKECEAKATDGGGKSLDIEMRDCSSRFASDVIATTAFGYQVNSMKDQSNDFYMAGKSLTDFSGLQLLKGFIIMLAPKISELLDITFFSRSVQNYFTQLLMENIKQRETHNVHRPDMLNLLLEAKKGTLTFEKSESDDLGFSAVNESEVGRKQTGKRLSDDDIVAQAFLFFIAGFETVSTFLSFVSYELALNLDIQDKLRQEVDETLKHSEELSYEMLQNMKYMDMVVSEILRLWSPMGVVDRVCEKPYTLEPSHPGGKPYEIKIGQSILLPILSLHRDPKYWEDPEKFIPERFSQENKHKITPFTYMPFGNGPRNCIGSRFALMETKVMIAYLVRNFIIKPSAKLQLPGKISADTFTLKLVGGFWVTLQPRS